ncbi:MAG: MBL fold metallo-hydrolase [Dehalococcoidia bacterium]
MEIRRIAMAYNNVYAVESGGARVLIDTGPDYRGARELLLEALDGWQPDLVVATHAHVDHAGLGAWWQARGVPVALSADDRTLASHPHYVEQDELAVMIDWVEASGAPEAIRIEAVEGLERRREWAMRAATEKGYPAPGSQPRWPTGLRYESFAASRTVADGDTVAPGLEVLLCPGHTPGNLVLAAGGHGVLFSGDQLLPDITPTPAIQAAPGNVGRFRSLPAFAAALERLRDLHFERCLPGHGEPFEDVDAAVEANLAAIEERTARVFAELRGAGECTLYELCERLYPRALRRRFWQIASTVQGHLDLLEARGAAHVSAGRYSALA